MSPFWYLVFAHLLLDYPLQGSFLAKIKAQNNYLLLVHSFIWGLGLCAVLTWLGLFQPWMLVWLIGGHFVIDWLKCHKFKHWSFYLWWKYVGNHLYKLDGKSHISSAEVPPWVTDPLRLALWIDQLLHVGQICICIAVTNISHIP